MTGLQRAGTSLGIVGLGYAGLPLAKEASAAGIRVVGFDIDASRVAALNDGASYISDLRDSDVADMLRAGCRFSTDVASLTGVDAIIISVPTPLIEATRTPDLSFLIAACQLISTVLSPGMTVILESTSYPGTTEDVVKPVLEKSGLEAGRDFHLAFSPERIDPGNPLHGVTNTRRIVAGLTPGCRERAVDILQLFCSDIVSALALREAEMAKLIENTYRQVNIALVNELLRASTALGVDVWESLRLAATKPFGFQAFSPGPGVGGHCIPVDPMYLAAAAEAAGAPLTLIARAQEINDSMPAFVVDRVGELVKTGRPRDRPVRVLLLGLTYKPDVQDVRGAPAKQISILLRARGFEVQLHDPFYDQWDAGEGAERTVRDLGAALGWSDLTVLVQAHSIYLNGQTLSGAHRILDTRGVLAPRPGVIWL